MVPSTFLKAQEANLRLISKLEHTLLWKSDIKQNTSFSIGKSGRLDKDISQMSCRNQRLPNPSSLPCPSHSMQLLIIEQGRRKALLLVGYVKHLDVKLKLEKESLNMLMDLGFLCPLSSLGEL